MKMLAAAALAALVMTAPAVAQAPDRPVTIVVPFASGGPLATLAGFLAETMTVTLGQPVTSTSVTGAGGTVGAAEVAAAAPDGNTILLSHVGLATAATFYRSLPYETATAFAPIGEIVDVPMAFIGRNDFAPGIGTLPELVAYLEANGAAVRMAHSGIGSSSHLCALLFEEATGVAPTLVSYDGTSLAMADLLSGAVDLMCDQVLSAGPQIAAGAVKGYAVTGAERLATLPDLPTAAEQGLTDFEFVVWHGLFAPAGTPVEAVDQLAAALQAALQDPALIARLAALGVTPVAVERASPGALAAHFAAEIDAWRPIIEATGVYAD